MRFAPPTRTVLATPHAFSGGGHAASSSRAEGGVTAAAKRARGLC